MWAQLGEEFPETSFLAFTKRWDIVEDIPFPDNFSIVYSAWPGEAMPPGDRPIAWMDDGTEPRIPSGAFLCEGGENGVTCSTCRKCWSPELENVVFAKH